MATQIVKKVTCAFGMQAAKVLKLVLEHPQRRPYAGRLVGIATGTKEGVSQHGAWVSLLGSFQFTSPEGEISRAVQAFGPDLVILPVVAALKGGQQSVNLAVDVYAIESEKSPQGWTYVCESAIEEQDSDPLALLLAKATPRPALPAPTPADAAPDTAPATTTKTVKKG